MFNKLPQPGGRSRAKRAWGRNCGPSFLGDNVAHRVPVGYARVLTFTQRGWHDDTTPA